MNDIYVFDAYGTLFDVHSAAARFKHEIGEHAEPMSEMWRIKQLEYAWTRTLMREYRDFRELTAQALDYAAARFGGISASLRAKLLSVYERLDAYPDAVPTLRKLKEESAHRHPVERHARDAGKRSEKRRTRRAYRPRALR
jgi:2-haloacid dehalogenase